MKALVQIEAAQAAKAKLAQINAEKRRRGMLAPHGGDVAAPIAVKTSPAVKAFWDSFSGLLRCEAIAFNPHTSMVTIRITSRDKRNVYAFGEIIETTARNVIPRASFRRSRRGPFHFYIAPAYAWRDLLPTESSR